MSDICKCSVCGRWYNDPIPRNLCEEMHKPRHRKYVNIGSRTWDARAIRWVIHSLAVEGPREVLKLSDRYKVVQQGRQEWLEYRPHGDVWVPTTSKSTEQIVLTAFHTDSDYLVVEDNISETQDAAKE